MVGFCSCCQKLLRLTLFSVLLLSVCWLGLTLNEALFQRLGFLCCFVVVGL